MIDKKLYAGVIWEGGLPEYSRRKAKKRRLQSKESCITTFYLYFNKQNSETTQATFNKRSGF